MDLRNDSLHLIESFREDPALKTAYKKFCACVQDTSPQQGEKFIKVLEKLLPTVPKALIGVRAAGQILLGHQKYLVDDIPGAEAAYLAASVLDPKCATAFYGAGCCRQRAGYFYSAVRHFLTATALAPHKIDYKLELAVAYFYHRDYTAAGEYLAALSAQPQTNPARAYYYYGLVLGRQGAAGAGRNNLLKALSLAPGDEKILAALNQANEFAGA